MITGLLERTLGKWIDKRGLNKGECITATSVIEHDPHALCNGTTIHLKHVMGGYLVTFNSYDRKEDRSEQKTYIITDEQDFQSELVKCIYMESLRR